MNESRTISKNLVSDQKVKTPSECNETLDVMKCLKFSVINRVFKTSFILKSEHFLCPQVQLRIKSWNYVFKCSQNIRFQNTRKVDICIEWIVEIFKTQIIEAKPTIVHINLQQTGINFVGECTAAFSPKELNVMKTLSFQDLSLFQGKYSVSKLLLWLVGIQLPIQDQYIHTSRENKQQKQL